MSGSHTRPYSGTQKSKAALCADTSPLRMRLWEGEVHSR